MHYELIGYAANIERKAATLPRSLDPFAGEIIGARFMHLLGIGAPTEIRVVNAAEAKAAGDAWVIKTYKNGRLRWFGGIAADINVLVARIPGTISLRALRRVYGVVGPEITLHGDDVVPGSWNIIERILWLGPEAADSEHSGFVLPDDLTAIRAAIEWNSDPMLAIHAARLFLGCSAAHAGNVLVDANAKLYSIDHEFCVPTDGADLDTLFKHMKKGTRAWRALGAVAALEPADVERLFDDLPLCVTWPLRSKYETVFYFLERLDFWKAAYLPVAA
jgi:hypothetical protein